MATTFEYKQDKLVGITMTKAEALRIFKSFTDTLLPYYAKIAEVQLEKWEHYQELDDVEGMEDVEDRRYPGLKLYGKKIYIDVRQMPDLVYDDYTYYMELGFPAEKAALMAYSY